MPDAIVLLDLPPAACLLRVNFDPLWADAAAEFSPVLTHSRCLFSVSVAFPQLALHVMLNTATGFPIQAGQ